jgi:hypothetical protein
MTNIFDRTNHTIDTYTDINSLDLMAVTRRTGVAVIESTTGTANELRRVTSSITVVAAADKITIVIDTINTTISSDGSHGSRDTSH